MQQAAVTTAAGDTHSYAINKDRHDILDPKSQLRVQAMNSIFTYKKGSSSRVFERALFRWWNSKRRLLPTELHLDELVATQPEAEEERWQHTREEVNCDFLKPFCLIAANGRTDQHSEEALTEFKERQIPDEQLTPQGWMDWYTRWSKAGCSVTEGVTCAIVHNYIMCALVLHRDSGKTLVLRHVVDKLFRRMAETGLRFSYVEGFLSVMSFLKPEEDKHRQEGE